MEIQVMEPTWI